MKILWDERAWEEYLSWQTEDRKTLKRINALIKDIQRNPFDGIGKSEPLKENLSKWWGRRIDGANCIVYKVKGTSQSLHHARGSMTVDVKCGVSGTGSLTHICVSQGTCPRGSSQV